MNNACYQQHHLASQHIFFFWSIEEWEGNVNVSYSVVFLSISPHNYSIINRVPNRYFVKIFFTQCALSKCNRFILLESLLFGDDWAIWYVTTAIDYFLSTWLLMAGYHGSLLCSPLCEWQHLKTAYLPITCQIVCILLPCPWRMAMVYLSGHAKFLFCSSSEEK